MGAKPSQLSPRQIQLLKELGNCKDEMSGQELHRVLTIGPSTMGLATVYRNLRQLQQKGLVRCRHLPTGEVLYAPMDRDHHHLTCVDCGKTLRMKNCPLHNIDVPIDQRDEFQLLFHTLEFFGLCKSCMEHQQVKDI